MQTAPYSCKTCTFSFSSEELYQKHKHKAIHLCSDCGKTFWKKSVLVKHVAYVHTPGGKPHKCPYQQCGKGYASRGLLADHVNFHTGFKPYKCNTCKRSYVSQHSYAHHVKTCSKNAKCKECGKQFSSDSVLADHIKTVHQYSWFACACGKKYRWRTNLSRHRRSCDAE